MGPTGQGAELGVGLGETPRPLCVQLLEQRRVQEESSPDEYQVLQWDCSQKRDGEETPGWGVVPARLGVGMLPLPFALLVLPTVPTQTAKLNRAWSSQGEKERRKQQP